MIFLQQFLFTLVLGRQVIDKFQALSKAADLRKISGLSQKSNLTIKGPLLGPFLIPRVSGTQGNKAVQKHIISFFEKMNWHIEQNKFSQDTPFGETEFNNIVVTKDINAHKRLVLAAHFDSKYFKEFEFIGAIDSAAPCAILMDVAATLDEAFNKRKEEGLDQNSTIQLIFFDGEEAMVNWSQDDSIYGARHLAKTWTNTLHTLTNLNDGTTFKKSPIEMIDAFVLLDLLGTKEASISNSQQATQWVWDRLCRIHEKLGLLKLLSPYMLERLKKGDYYFRPGSPTISSYALQDDHVPFLNLGVPICHIIPTPFPNVWHRETDNADALDEGNIMDLSLTFRVLASEYFGLHKYI